MSGFRKNRPLRPFTWLLFLGAVAFAAGCSTANTTGGGGTSANHILPDGTSVAGWTIPAGGSLHAITATNEYVSNGVLVSCTGCHGGDLSGGISKTSCFDPSTATGCHHGTITPWFDFTPGATQQHGVSAKKAPGDGSFFACQICHGNDFSGGGVGVACEDCHGVPAPHPFPWRIATGSAFDHRTTNTANAPVCFGCHADSPAGNANNPHRPPSPAAAGTPPGCFNGTMCHNQAGAPHPVGATWVTTPPAAQPHGNDAKATPVAGGTTGFAYCQDCHGTGTTFPANFQGGTSGISCYTCHGVNAPHAPKPWRASAGSTYDHTITNGANAPVCQQCHFPGSPNNPPGHPPTPAPAGTAPGCFNSTLCHAADVVAHPVPFIDSSHFTVTAATFPASCSACHDVATPTVKSGPVCRTCHVADSPLTAANCTSCHAGPPNGLAPAGAAYPNIAGAHSVHLGLNSAGSPISCDTCHNGLGTNTLNHYNRANGRAGAGGRVPPGDAAFPATYNAKTGASSFVSAAFTCTNVSCHGGTALNWQTSVIDVNTQCTLCHAFGTSLGNPQYNSPFSGRHNINTSHRNCTNCHNTTTLAVNHFTTLGTTAMEGPASATIGGAGTSIPAGNYIPASGSCTPSCHGNEIW